MLSRYLRKLLPPTATAHATGVHFLLPYLLTAFHDSINWVAVRLVCLAKAFHKFDWPMSVELVLRAVKDADCAEVLTMSCAGKLTFIEVF